MKPISKPDWWEKWTRYDEENMQLELKDDAPEEVRQEWEEMMEEMYPEIPEPPSQ